LPLAQGCTHIVHHLRKSDEENYGAELRIEVNKHFRHRSVSGAYSVDEEPVLGDGIAIKEELCTHGAHVQKIVDQAGDPLKEREAGARFEHEKRGSLLKEQANNNGAPVREGQEELKIKGYF
jgi:hypothetical protein